MRPQQQPPPALQTCSICGQMAMCLDMSPGVFVCVECEDDADASTAVVRVVESTPPTPAHVRTFAAAKLRTAADAIQQAIIAVRSLPSIGEHERPLSNARRDVLGAAAFIDPSKGD